MPRYNVNHNNKWACFSSICDAFITEFMDKDIYEEWRKVEYGLCDYEPAEKRNMMNMHDAVSSIRLNRNHEDAIKCLLEAGLPQDECEQLMYDIETEYYVPKLDDDGNYICPNCGEVVEKYQKMCKRKYCEAELVWR